MVRRGKLNACYGDGLSLCLSKMIIGTNRLIKTYDLDLFCIVRHGKSGALLNAVATKIKSII
jgi:hypothetical protein